MIGDEAIVVNKLLRWAEWKMGSGVQLGYKSHVNFLKLAGGSGWHDESIDSECLLTDEAVEQLPIMHKELIRLEYLGTLKDEQFKARAFFDGSVRSWRQWKHDAHNKIANYLKIRLTMLPISEHNSSNLSNCVQMTQQADYISSSY
ncbi:hypothetical protein [Nitrosomonas communis]|uniref:Phage antitermination protein Q n=1 Tax=Nitrosomonas communis TaxID=44574 RepID=A0A1I4XB85_9PROT|nr:hypothetical protein [Nitrosomonas communis]SFN23178.1 hypothetical protein SAMN05421863_11484 [Nitrosomonas communis]